MRRGVAGTRAAIDLHLGRSWSLLRIAKLLLRPPVLGLPHLLDNMIPVILLVLGDTLVECSIGEQLTHVFVVRCFFKAQVPHVLQIFLELLGKARTQLIHRGRLLLLANLLILLLVSRSLQTLPRQTTPQKVHENMAESFEIIASRLFPPEMGIDTHVPRRSGEGFSLAIRNVLLRFGIPILLRHSKVDNVNRVVWFLIIAQIDPANQEIVGLDVAIDEVLLVNCLDSGELCDQLVEIHSTAC